MDFGGLSSRNNSPTVFLALDGKSRELEIPKSLLNLMRSPHSALFSMVLRISSDESLDSS